MGSKGKTVWVSCVPLENPNGEIHRLLDAKDFCDATIVCGPKRIAVHKNVLSARSEFFHKAFTVNMKVRL